MFTHPAVPIALGVGLGRQAISTRLLLLGCLVSIAPDFDVISFWLGIPYSDPFGHRGFTHSITFALGIALLSALAARQLQTSARSVAAFVFVSMASHGLLDTLTNGGLGIALLWPFSNERFFAPVQVVAVSPIGPHFFSSRGLTVLASEFVWVWLPCLAATVGMVGWQRLLSRRRTD